MLCMLGAMDNESRTDAAPKDGIGLSAMWEIRDGARTRLAAVFFRMPPAPAMSASPLDRARTLGWRGVIVGGLGTGENLGGKAHAIAGDLPTLIPHPTHQGVEVVCDDSAIKCTLDSRRVVPKGAGRNARLAPMAAHFVDELPGDSANPRQVISPTPRLREGVCGCDGAIKCGFHGHHSETIGFRMSTTHSFGQDQ